MEETIDSIARIRAIFNSDREKYGDYHSPTRDGLIELAKQGCEAWNIWRLSNPGVLVDFRLHDFTKTPIDFSGFKFPSTVANHPCANFSGAKFDGRTRFCGTHFEDDTLFIDCEFTDGSANFHGANFGDRTNFTTSKFEISPSFEDTCFGDLTTFTGSQFGYRAKFKNSKLGNSTCFYDCNFDEITEFTNCTFGEKTDFRLSKFNDQALFYLTNFDDNALFTDCEFGDATIFDFCVFGKSANFDDITFGTSTRIQNCKFGDHSSFIGSKFDISSDFTRTAFGDQTNFAQSVFVGKTTFFSAFFGKWSSFENCAFLGPTCFDITEFNGSIDFSFNRQGKSNNSTTLAKPFAKYLQKERKSKKVSIDPISYGEFSEISFSGAKFRGDANFTGRKFKAKTNFGPYFPQEQLGHPKAQEVKRTEFLGFAEFHDCEFNQDTNFDEAHFAVKQEQTYVRAFRTLKGIMRSLNAVKEEQLFFRLEIEAEHATYSNGRKLLYSIYKKTSFYGASISKPIFTLAFSAIIISLLHGSLVNLTSGKIISTSVDEIDWETTYKWATYSALNAIPLPGFDKTQIQLRESLFLRDKIDQSSSRKINRASLAAVYTCAIGLEIIEKMIALGCAFLLGLALRNLFKMKS